MVAESDTSESSLNVDRNVGARLVVLRLENAMSIEDAAEVLGVTPDVYAAYERGERRLRPPGMIRLSERFGVSLSSFFAACDTSARERDNVQPTTSNIISLAAFRQARTKNGN